MRITNKIMQNNSLSNINTNKILQDKLNTQMATGKKINRPSDDPVVAIRALRLRTNVSQVTQYYEKNSPDAESWLKITEDALSTVSDVITDMIKSNAEDAVEENEERLKQRHGAQRSGERTGDGGAVGQVQHQQHRNQ